jgi:LPXTG-motif cell wall-anchored protein
VPGALLGTVTKTVTVPYRPSADPVNCPSAPTAWFNAGTSTCHNGFAFTATFDFVPLVLTVPDRVIVTVAFNTEHHGAAPLSVPGPYNSLNVAVSTGLAPTVGTDVDTDSMFLDSSWGGAYADGGTGGLDTLRADDGGWTGYGLALEVTTYDVLSTLPFDPGPTSGGGAAGGAPTLAATGSEPSPWTGIAGLAAVLLGLGLVVLAPRRGVHRA